MNEMNECKRRFRNASALSSLSRACTDFQTTRDVCELVEVHCGYFPNLPVKFLANLLVFFLPLPVPKPQACLDVFLGHVLHSKSSQPLPAVDLLVLRNFLAPLELPS